MFGAQFTEKNSYEYDFNKIKSTNKHLTVLSRKSNNKLKCPNDICPVKCLLDKTCFTDVIILNNVFAFRRMEYRC